MNAVLSALANGLVLSILLAAVVWLALRIFKRSFNAATRYAIWWITLLAMVVLPIFLLVAANRRATAPPRATEQTTQIAPASPATPVSQSAFGPEQLAGRKFSWLPSLPVRLPFSPWTARFAELWGLVSLLLLARLAAGFTSLHFQKKYAREAPPELRELLDYSLARLAIKRRVRVALISEGNSPMLAGVSRPQVLIPERLLSELDHAELEQIFLHEATHAARYDDWTLLLQRVIQAVFIFYPVVYWTARQINLEREAACDAHVIAITGDPRAYAKCLTHVAELSLGEWKSPLVAAIADEKSYLTRRIVLLLDKHRHTGTRLLMTRLALAATVVCLLAALGATSPAFLVMGAPQESSTQTFASPQSASGSSGTQPAVSVPTAPRATIRVAVIEPTKYTQNDEQFMATPTGLASGENVDATRGWSVLSAAMADLKTKSAGLRALVDAPAFNFSGSFLSHYESNIRSPRFPSTSFARLGMADCGAARGRWIERPGVVVPPAIMPVVQCGLFEENKSFLVPQTLNSNSLLGYFSDRTPPDGRPAAGNLPLASYIQFAYKLDWSQARSLWAQMPKWALQASFDLGAHADDGLASEQDRLTVQSLLAERFKLAVHFEIKEGPAYALVLTKPGKLGSQLRSYPDGFVCSDIQEVELTPVTRTVDDGRFPASCGAISWVIPSRPGFVRQAGRNISMQSIVDWVSSSGDLDRPLVDQTGLNGAFDLSVESELPPQQTPTGFLAAVNDQLGFKLQSVTAPARLLVIDHVEEPRTN